MTKLGMGAVVLALASTVFSAAPRAQDDTKLNPTDTTFVMNAAKGGMAEVELGNLAVQNATSEKVKQFAQRMVDDHTKANVELKALAEKKHVTLPTDADPQDKALHDRLSVLKGPQFDREYMHTMLEGHRKVADEFRAETKSGTDPEVTAFAAKTLPTIEQHLRLAQDASRAVGTSGTIKK